MAQESTRGKRRARTKQAILDAALDIVAGQGSEGLSMREIAQRIEYSPSGLYEYFQSKDEIIEAICQQGDDMLAERLRRCRKSESVVRQLEEAGKAYLEFAARHSQQYLLMFGGITNGESTLEELNQEKAYHELRQIVQAGIVSGEFSSSKDYGLDEIAFQSWALVHGLAMLRLTHFQQQGSDFDAFNLRILAGFVRGLR